MGARNTLTYLQKLAASEDLKQTSSQDLDQQRRLRGDRGVQGLSEEDVYLYPCGMSSIYHAHQIAMIIGDAKQKSVCFG